jgi:hypothetical protein
MRRRSNRGGKPGPSEKVKGKTLATVPQGAPPQGDPPPPAPPPAPPPPPDFDPDNGQ